MKLAGVMIGTLGEGRLYLYDLPFNRGEDVQRRPLFPQSCLDDFDHAIQSVVISERIVMGQCDPLHPGMLAKRHRVVDGAMAPSNLGRVLFGGVLRIVDEKIGASNEFSMLQVLPSDGPMAGCQFLRVGFVVAGIYDRCPVGLQPIAKRERRMIQIVGGHPDIVDIEGALDEVMIANPRCKLIERDGEIGVFHLPGQGFTQGLAESFGAVYVPFVAGFKKRSEEWDALNVIPMRMTDQDVAAQAFTAGRYELLTKSMSSGSAIKNNKRSSCRRTSMHDVFPPYRAMLGPGLAMEPRVPQNFTRTWTYLAPSAMPISY